MASSVDDDDLPTSPGDINAFVSSSNTGYYPRESSASIDVRYTKRYHFSKESFNPTHACVCSSIGIWFRGTDRNRWI
jgi:hypothetical protein